MTGELHPMRRALRLACESVGSGGGPFGAVIMRGTEVVAEGTNRVTVWSDPTAHAEVVAIRAACLALSSFELRGCDLFSSCEPCPMCMAAAHWARVDRIFFSGTRRDAAAAGFDDALLYEQFALPLDVRLTPTRPLMGDEAAAPFDLWRARADRVPY